MSIYSGNIIYEDSTITYDSGTVQYGGITDVWEITNKIVINTKSLNRAVVNTKTVNSLVERPTQTHYWRIYAGMSMGLLLSLTYSVDQDGVERT
mgnify:FL=1